MRNVNGKTFSRSGLSFLKYFNNCLIDEWESVIVHRHRLLDKLVTAPRAVVRREASPHFCCSCRLFCFCVLNVEVLEHNFHHVQGIAMVFSTLPYLIARRKQERSVIAISMCGLWRTTCSPLGRYYALRLVGDKASSITRAELCVCFPPLTGFG